MLNAGLDLCLFGVQPYMQPWKLSEKAYSQERNRKAVKVLLASISMLIKEWDKKLLCFVWI